MLEQAQAEGQVDVLNFVRAMREQRFRMVQTLVCSRVFPVPSTYSGKLTNWFDFALTLTDVCMKHCILTGDSGEIRTHDLLLTSADVLTSRPPSLPVDDWPASILYSCGFRDIYRLMKFLRRVDARFSSICKQTSPYKNYKFWKNKSS